jgi:hypothetical protein
MDLSALINNNSNKIELYFCSEEISLDGSSFNCSWESLPRIPLNIFKGRIDQKLIEYCHRDLIYSYDISNDSQRVYQNTLINDKVDGKIYIVNFNEEVHPTHRFPCTSEINEKREIYKVIYKINNRMSFIIEQENERWTLYLKYNHSSVVDMESMNKDWNEKLSILLKNIYKR